MLANPTYLGNFFFIIYSFNSANRAFSILVSFSFSRSMRSMESEFQTVGALAIYLRYRLPMQIP